MPVLKTVGYEAASLRDFITTLRTAEVQCLVDVRALPLSRKPGFSKTSLQDHLRRNQIDYIHMKSLGNPSNGREAAKDKRYGDFRRIFGHHLSTPEAQAALCELGRLLRGTQVCLMCYERCPTHCHRSLVVDAVRAMFEVKVVHLMVGSREIDAAAPALFRGRRSHNREGSPAAKPALR